MSEQWTGGEHRPNCRNETGPGSGGGTEAAAVASVYGEAAGADTATAGLARGVGWEDTAGPPDSACPRSQ